MNVRNLTCLQEKRRRFDILGKEDWCTTSL